jgi:sterol desaturase/sphingolipid hydroxylase (fatty acid hydroxylase superfamily)
MSAHIVEICSALTLLFIIPRILYSLIGIHPMVVYFTPFIMTAHGVLEHCGYDDYSREANAYGTSPKIEEELWILYLLMG